MRVLLFAFILMGSVAVGQSKGPRDGACEGVLEGPIGFSKLAGWLRSHEPYNQWPWQFHGDRIEIHNLRIVESDNDQPHFTIRSPFTTVFWPRVGLNIDITETLNFALLGSVYHLKLSDREDGLPPYHLLKTWARFTNIRTYQEWQNGPLPPHFPRDLMAAYSDHPHFIPWEGWARFRYSMQSNGGPLDVVGVSTDVPVERTRDLVQSLGISSEQEWTARAARKLLPSGFPSSLRFAYKTAFASDPHFFDSRKTFRDFTAAREWAWNSPYRSLDQWVKAYKAGLLPDDMPPLPQFTYLGQYADEFDFFNRWFPFEKAREWARGSRVGSELEWAAWARYGLLHPRVPPNPQLIYVGQFVSYEDFVGNVNRYVPFGSARATAHSSTYATLDEWLKAYKSGRLGYGLPPFPDITYAGQFVNELYFFGKSGRFRSFEAARSWAKAHGIQSQEHWRKMSRDGKLPKDIPAAPDEYYRDWQSWGHFLGTGTIATIDRVYRSYEDARQWARENHIRSEAQWWQAVRDRRIPFDIPATPDRVYSEWQGWGHFLGTGTIATIDRVYRSFEAARQWAKAQGVKSKEQWRQLARDGKLPKDIPAAPDQVYSEWQGWGHFLGTGAIATFERQFRSFEEARQWVQEQNIKTQAEWNRRARQPDFPSDIPTRPDQVYSEWQGWGHFLGTGTLATINRVYRTFEEARKWARENNIRTRDQWRAAVSSKFLPSDIPAAPDQVYSEWQGWGHFLRVPMQLDIN